MPVPRTGDNHVQQSHEVSRVAFQQSLQVLHHLYRKRDLLGVNAGVHDGPVGVEGLWRAMHGVCSLRCRLGWAKKKTYAERRKNDGPDFIGGLRPLQEVVIAGNGPRDRNTRHDVLDSIRMHLLFFVPVNLQHKLKVVKRVLLHSRYGSTHLFQVPSQHIGVLVAPLNVVLVKQKARILIGLAMQA